MMKEKAGSSNKITSNTDIRRKAAVDSRLDEELAETFPASDAPTVTRSGAEHVTNNNRERRKDEKAGK